MDRGPLAIHCMHVLLGTRPAINPGRYMSYLATWAIRNASYDYGRVDEYSYWPLRCQGASGSLPGSPALLTHLTRLLATLASTQGLTRCDAANKQTCPRCLCVVGRTSFHYDSDPGRVACMSV